MADPCILAPPARRRRVPAFTPVPVRARRDGWTPARQAAFIAALSLTRCVSTAARRVGMSRESAHRLRRHPAAQSFAAAWDAIVHNHGQPIARKVTPAELWLRVERGLLQPVTHRGRHTLTYWKPDVSALLTLIRRFAQPPDPY